MGFPYEIPYDMAIFFMAHPMVAPSHRDHPRLELQLQALEGRHEAGAGVNRRCRHAGNQGETCRTWKEGNVASEGTKILHVSF